MVKECPITINNEAVTVAMYDDVAVQFPSIHDKYAQSLKVNYKNNRYTIVDEQKEEPKKVAEPTAE